MTESKFKKLVNLYIDKEISAHELTLLKQAIAASAARRNEFNQFLKIHLAERQALLACSAAPQRAHKTCQVPTAHGLTLKFPTPRKTKLTHLMEYGGMAAGFTLLLFFAGSVFKQTPGNFAVTEAEPVDVEAQALVEHYLANSKAYNNVDPEPDMSRGSIAVFTVHELADAQPQFAGYQPTNHAPSAFIDDMAYAFDRSLSGSDDFISWPEEQFSSPEYGDSSPVAAWNGSLVPAASAEGNSGFTFRRAAFAE